MKVIYGVGPVKPALKNTIAAIGIFDGVHRGHQLLIRQMVTCARRKGSKSLVITFHPHPVEVLHHRKVDYLASLSQRLDLIKDLGADAAAVIKFTPGFARLDPEDFVRRYLIKRWDVKEVFVGDDFRFGQNRSGDVGSFEQLGLKYGFVVHPMHPVKKISEKISSSWVRELIASGRLKEASSMLGRHVSVVGKVVHGSSRGKMLGYPTANIHVESGIMPPQGVYVVRVGYMGHTINGMANIGFRPSFAGPNLKMHLEVHLLDFKKNIYGRTLVVEFLKKIRDEQRFSALEHLVEQIRKDEQLTRRFFR